MYDPSYGNYTLPVEWNALFSDVEDRNSWERLQSVLDTPHLANTVVEIRVMCRLDKAFVYEDLEVKREFRNRLPNVWSRGMLRVAVCRGDLSNLHPEDLVTLRVDS